MVREIRTTTARELWSKQICVGRSLLDYLLAHQTGLHRLAARTLNILARPPRLVNPARTYTREVLVLAWQLRTFLPAGPPERSQKREMTGRWQLAPTRRLD